MNRHMRMPEVEWATGYKAWSIYKKIREGTFPKSIKLGPRAVAWKESEVQAWMDMRERLTRDEDTCVDDKVEASGTNSPV